MDVPLSPQTLDELALTCAKSRARAAARRASSARRAALNRRALRALVVLAIAAAALVVETTDVETAPVKTAPAKSWTPRWPAFSPVSCGIPKQFADAFRAASRETGLSLPLLAAVAWEESRMDPGARSPAGARGLLQLMPGTAKIVAVASNGPRANILAGARYLRLMIDRFEGDLELALAAYNAGPTAVEEAGAAPSIETLRYAKNIEARALSPEACT